MPLCRLFDTLSRKDYFEIQWEERAKVIDPTRAHDVLPLKSGQVCAIWDVEEGPNWRTYVRQHKPFFFVTLIESGALVMINPAHMGEIREMEIDWGEES